MSENEKYVPAEASVGNDPTIVAAKRSFSDTVNHYNTIRGTRNFEAMTQDIVCVVREWGSASAQEMSSAYPGWTRRDFITLLDELKIDWERPADEVQLQYQERVEKNAERIKLANLLVKNEATLAKIYENKKWKSLDRTWEQDLERARDDLKREQDALSQMGFLSKRFSERGKIVKENVLRSEKNIQRLENLIHEKPLAIRQAEEQLAEAEESRKISALLIEIEKIKGSMAILEKELQQK